MSTTDRPGSYPGTDPYAGSPEKNQIAAGSDRLLADITGRPLEMETFLEIGVQCAAAVAAIHSENRIHRNISPYSIRLGDSGRTVSLEESVTGGEEADRPSYLERLAYISPEQTGRINRSVDYRTDIYSLGVVFYELITGLLPFRARNPLEWVHYHIARQPAPPRAVNPLCPAAVSRIIMKMLAKSADDRYQTATGLRRDLERCREEIRDTGSIEDWEPGQNDISELFTMPQKLYGRRDELAILTDCLNRAIGGEGCRVFISGYAGSGKSRLVHEIVGIVARNKGFFIEGKFDPARRDIPYSAIIQAIHELGRQLLACDPCTLQQWQSDLRAALGANTRLIVDLAPEMELVLGTRPPVPALGPEESRNRLNLVLQTFFHALARPESPLVLFLDNMQNADTASLGVLEHVIGGPDLACTMFIGSLQTPGPREILPVTGLIESLSRNGIAFSHIALDPLRLEDVAELLADMTGAGPERITSLAAVVWDKSRGNPLFLQQFLRSAYDEGLLYFNRSRGRWDWNLEGIGKLPFTDNVGELMAFSIDRLNPGTRFLLARAACIGFRFSLGLLAKLADLAIEECFPGLTEAESSGLVQINDGGLENGSIVGWNSETTGQFVHHRVQEACYSLVLESQQPAIHREIAELLHEQAATALRDDLVFEVAEHYTRALPALTDSGSRLEATLALQQAGQKARLAAAPGQASNYLNLARTLLPGDAWGAHYHLTYEIHKDLAECEYLTGRHEQAEEIFELIIGQAATLIDKAEIFNMRIILYAAMGQFMANNRLGIEALHMFGHHLPDIDDAESLEQTARCEYCIYQELIGERPISSLIDLPPMTDPDKLVCARIYMNMLSSAYVSNPLLLEVLGIKSVNMALQDGFSPDSTFSFSVWALLLCARYQDYPAGYEFGRLALAYNDRYRYAATRSNTPFVFGNFINHWLKPISDNLDYLYEALQAGIETGDLIYASFAATSIPRVLLSYGHHHLQHVLEETDKTLAFFRRIRNLASLERQEYIKHIILGLMGLAPSDNRHSKDGFDEESHIARLQEINYGTGIALYYYYKALDLYTREKYREALEHIQKAREYLPYIAASSQEADCVFLHAMCRAAAYSQIEDPAGREALAGLARDLELFRRWQAANPFNYLGKYILIQAEQARIAGRLSEAEELYEEALANFRGNGFLHNEALALQRAADHYAARGRTLTARAYLKESRSVYERWGAAGKVADLDRRHPHLLDEEKQAVTRELGRQMSQADLLSVIKASQALSGQILLPRLIESLMQIVLENAGAERGCMAMEENGLMKVIAISALQGDQVATLLMDDTALNGEMAPVNIINFCSRSRKTVILNDAGADPVFSADDYISGHGVVSVLCIPLIRQAEVMGILYLENNLSPGVFTADKQEVLEIIAGQAAISWENARLYANLQASEARLNTVIGGSPAPLFAIDKEHRVIYWNRAMELSTGIAAAEVLGTNRCWSGFFDNERPCLVDLLVDGATSEDISLWYGDSCQPSSHMAGAYDIIAYYPRLDKWLAGTAITINDGSGQIIGGVEITIDITDRKHAEAALAASEEKYSRAFLYAADVIGIIRLADRTFVELSEAFFRIFGYARDSIIGCTSDEIGLWHNPKDRLNLYRLLAERSSVHDYETSWVAIDGEARTGLCSVETAEINGEDCLIFVWHDITERKRIEAEREELIRELEAKNAELERFAYTVSHDLKSPLITIKGFLGYLNKDISSGRTDQALQDLQRISTAADKMQGLLNELLELSRIGRIMNPPEAIMFSDLAAEAIAMVEGRIKARGVQIEIEENLPVIYGDRVRLREVMENLIDNAVKFMGDQEHPVITVGVARDSGETAFYIKDNGLGIDPAYHHKVFGLFEKLDQHSEGTGMGLAIVKRIVEIHGGHIWIESGGHGLGSTFYFTLPDSRQDPGQDGAI